MRWRALPTPPVPEDVPQLVQGPRPEPWPFGREGKPVYQTDWRSDDQTPYLWFRAMSVDRALESAESLVAEYPYLGFFLAHNDRLGPRFPIAVLSIPSHDVESAITSGSG